RGGPRPPGAATAASVRGRTRAVWDVLESCGLRPFDSDSAKEEAGRGGGGSLAPEKDGVAVSWSFHGELNRRVYDGSRAGLRLLTSATVLTGAVSAVLLAHSFHVRAEYLDVLPMHRLLVTDRHHKVPELPWMSPVPECRALRDRRDRRLVWGRRALGACPADRVAI
ncbi:hypothetical protein ACWD33_19315, partial [Streptomyces xiamenensis]